MNINLPLPPQFTASKVFVKPHIPKKLLDQALEKIAPSLNSVDDVLLLVPEGFLGSGKEGLVFTKDHFYFRKALSPEVIGNISDCSEVSYIAGFMTQTLIFSSTSEDNKWEFGFTQVSKADIEKLAKYIENVINFLKDINAPKVEHIQEKIAPVEMKSPMIEIDKPISIESPQNVNTETVLSVSSSSEELADEFPSRYFGTRIDNDSTPEPPYFGESVVEEVPMVESNSIVGKFFQEHSDSIFAKLKSSGMALTASALQNDENIIKIAGIVHNVLPGPLRFIVSVSVIENFLLENRVWLINKLK